MKPLLDYASQVWYPILRKDVEAIQRIQKRTTKIPTECKGKVYEQRLEKFGVTGQDKRRIRWDLILMFKILKLNEPIKWERAPFKKSDFLSHGLASSISRRHNRICRVIFSARQSIDFTTGVIIRHNFFLNRIVSTWNSLPENFFLL